MNSAQKIYEIKWNEMNQKNTLMGEQRAPIASMNE